MNWYDNLSEKEATEIMYKSLKIEERLEYDYDDLVKIEEFNEELHRGSFWYVSRRRSTIKKT